MNMRNTQLFFIVSLMSANSINAMSIDNHEPSTKSSATSHLVVDTTKEYLGIPRNSANQIIGESLTLDIPATETTNETVKTVGKLALLWQACTGTIPNAILLSGSYLCIEKPELIKTGLKKAQPYTKALAQKVGQAKQHVNRENCGRAMKRCPNTCQKFASIMTFGYYKPEEQIKLRSRKKSQ
ncbi:MAG: hypothetical protein P4L31_06960 [Candidatus Babeliales bacterium]|nr:hypothetical protein [Candidatus Babeliales bacterium]